MEIALSRRFAGLPDHRQALVRAQLADLSDIEIVAPKELVPVMSALATVVSTNVLTADAVASALVLDRSEEHTSELQSLMRISYAVFCLKKKIIHLTLYDKHSNHE